jgi:alkylation response protein AidB-like acyl-CoA dehydrogenase
MKYQAPLTDMRFVLHDVLDVASQFAEIPEFASTDKELIDQILAEAAKFAEQVLLPTNQIGDSEGAHFDKDTKTVTLPKAFHEAFQAYVDGGWLGLCGDPQYGGQGMPESLGYVVKEMIESCNVAWGTYPLLSLGSVDAFMLHGADWQKEIFVTQMLAGKWTGTMCLTEPHCGSDLGLLKSKAEPGPADTYLISGQKIFITAGEHDLAENIIHLVLARLPDAPAGTKGISLFIVPKFKVARDGTMGARNSVSAGNIEHKMGLKGSATCVMNFDAAEGYLIGQPNRGLMAMFTMMNAARLGVGVQGLGLIETSFQSSLAYAAERLQMRSLSGPKRPDKPADPITVHPDVRRMLLTQKVLAEGGRVLCFHAGLLVDQAHRHPDPAKRQRSEDLLGFLVPICKALLTEAAVECTYHGVQVLGGHGYIKEWGLEQLARDARITTIYEGTTQIQALDLLGRKIMATQGAGLRHFLAHIEQFVQAHHAHPIAGKFVKVLAEHAQQWSKLTQDIVAMAQTNPEEMGAAAVDYLFYAGYITLAYYLALEVEAAHRSTTAVALSAEFKSAKIASAEFYFARILPRTLTHAANIRAGSASLMSAPEHMFAA